MLYLPALWYHRVSQNGITVAVNYWHDMQFDQKYVYYRFLQSLAAKTTTAAASAAKRDPRKGGILPEGGGRGVGGERGGAKMEAGDEQKGVVVGRIDEGVAGVGAGRQGGGWSSTDDGGRKSGVR